MTEPKQKKKYIYIYIYTKGHVKGDKIERTEEIKENQGSKAFSFDNVSWAQATLLSKKVVLAFVYRRMFVYQLTSPP